MELGPEDVSLDSFQSVGFIGVRKFTRCPHFVSAV